MPFCRQAVQNQLQRSLQLNPCIRKQHGRSETGAVFQMDKTTVITSEVVLARLQELKGQTMTEDQTDFQSEDAVASLNSDTIQSALAAQSELFSHFSCQFV